MRKTSRHSLIIWLTASMCLLLVIRLFCLTVVSHDKWEQRAADASERYVYEAAPRGDITDRSGRLLAGSRPVYSVTLDRTGADEETLLESGRKAIELLDGYGEDDHLPYRELEKSMTSQDTALYIPVEICSGISEKAASGMEKARLSGINVRTDHVRYYPQGSLASHIIGYVGSISEEETDEYNREKGYRNDDIIGKSGIERYCESSLKGVDGRTGYQVDASGKVRGTLESRKAEKGSSVRLTIDSDLQKITEDALKQAVSKASTGGTFASRYGDVQMAYAPNADVGAAAVIDVDSGEILAMASTPDYDPNDFTGTMSQEKWASLQQEDPDDPLSPSPLYNVATMTAVQPGSAFKPVTALAALSCGLDPDRLLYDNGYIEIGGRRFGCSLWNESGGKHGYLDLAGAMSVSCNYYFYDIAAGRDLASGKSLGYSRKISNETIVEYAKLMGLGEKTGVEIGESSGVLPSEKMKTEGIKEQLAAFLLAEQEIYFTEKSLTDRKTFRKKIEKITNWADKDLSLNEIIGKLKSEKIVRKEKLKELAGICHDDYFSQTGWQPGDTFNIAIGQGDNAYTVLQMADYMAVLGNGGLKKGVTLIADHGGISRDAASETGRLNSKDTEYMISSMTEVTESDDGTLHGIFAGFPYHVAAKTGTAQRAGRISDMDEQEYLRRYLHLIAPDVMMADVEKETQRLSKAYPDMYEDEDCALRRAVVNLSGRDLTSDDIDRYKRTYDAFAWTVALAPADDPEIAVAVMLVQGKTSVNAAPVVREIIGRYGEKVKWVK